MSSHLAREIATQPDDWSDIVGRLEEHRDVLPQDGERVAVIGCGTSWFMGQAYAARRESSGRGVTDAFTAREHRLGRGYDKVVLICRSGTTTEVCEVVDHLTQERIEHVAIVATADTPVATRARHAILMDQVDEQSVVQTRFATTTLALLRASLGDSLDAAIADARAIVAEDEETAFAGLMDVEQVTFLGTDWTIGLAQEAALKLRESAQFWAEAYPSMEYRHGPISIAAPGRATWVLGEVPAGLADEVRAAGAHLEHRDIDPMAELVRVQRYSLARALQAGLDPDEPRNLTRSIVLT